MRVTSPTVTFTREEAALFDSTLDSLPAATRVRLLKAMAIESEAKLVIKPWLRLAQFCISTILMITIQLPLTILGVLMCFTIVLIPIGIALMGLGAFIAWIYPSEWVLEKEIKSTPSFGP